MTPVLCMISNALTERPRTRVGIPNTAAWTRTRRIRKVVRDPGGTGGRPAEPGSRARRISMATRRFSVKPAHHARTYQLRL
jgi:hypothetical protein